MPAPLNVWKLKAGRHWTMWHLLQTNWSDGSATSNRVMSARNVFRRMKKAGTRCEDMGRKLGDPTVVPADPTLVQVLERLHEVKIPDRLTPVVSADLYFLQAAKRPDILGNLGNYEVEEVIGQGGMGVVLKAYEPALHRHVAIKVMAAAVAGSATARRRFTREAQAAAAVCHENIVPVYGVNEVDGLPYLVMQFVVGESLQDRLDRTGPLALAEIVRIGLQTAAGLTAAHAQGLIHRDIKPANLLLENDTERVKITDFGLARMIDDVQLTQDGVVTGTPEYMAPEQARGEAVDHLADLFSLGSVLYAMATGGPPFHASSAIAVLRQVSEQTQAPITTMNPNMPDWLDALIARLLAKNPMDRFQSAAEVVNLLSGYLAYLEQPEKVTPPEVPNTKKNGRQGDREIRRKPIGLLLSLSPSLLVLIAVGFGFAAWIAGCGSGPPNEPAEFHHDFRGRSLPKEMERFNVRQADLVHEETEGLRISIPETWTHPPGGVGVKSAFGLRGDFDATTTFEILRADNGPKAPPDRIGVGVSFAIDLAGYPAFEQTASFLRVLNPNGKQVVQWNWKHDGRVDSSNLLCADKVVRLRLKRTGSSLYWFWAPGTEGDEFQEVFRCEFGSGDIDRIRLTAVTGQKPVNVEVRWLDLRVRGHFIDSSIFAASKGGLATALLFGMVITLLLALTIWFFLRRRRDNLELTELTAGSNQATQSHNSYLPSGLLALVALGFGAAAWFVGFGGGPDPDKDATQTAPDEMPTVFYHDFRGRHIPSKITLFNLKDNQVGVFAEIPVLGATSIGLIGSPFGQGPLLAVSELFPRKVRILQVEPEGLRMIIPIDMVPTGEGYGIKTNFGLQGDFEVTVAFEILRADTPSSDNGIGLSLFLFRGKAGGGTQIARLAMANLSQVVSWDWWKSNPHQGGEVPCTDNVGRMRLKRIGATVHYLWAPGTQGDNFKKIGRCEWGNTDIEYIRLAAYTGKKPCNLDLRLFDMRIRGQQEIIPVKGFSQAPGQKKALRGPAGALLLGMVITMGFALGLWYAVRRRRQIEELAGPMLISMDKTETTPATITFKCINCQKNLKAKPELVGKKIKCPQCGQTVLIQGAD